ncbi:hypothetical protein ACMD2_22622 [Ananas comosus]|uniref:Uncharacterized protein n=1 Tax=Ananas comosus TaxID=4615 RepID=A0A199VB00_ANACO|nr:hypothetical protein ACMD2_22622 [Ananas comosus]
MFNSIRSRLLPTRRRPPSHGVVFFLGPPNPSLPKFLSSSSTTTTTLDSQTLTYLIDFCGLSRESAISASQKLHLKSTEKPSAVLGLFREYGFGKTDISKIITKIPTLLTCDPHKILKPKLDFFRSVGFSGDALSRLIALSPLLLRRSLEDHLIPCFTFLRTLLHSNDNVVAVFSHAPHALNSNLVKTIMPSLQVLRKHNLPEERIAKLVTVQPGILMQAPGRVNEIVEEVNATGIQTSDPIFIYAFGTLSGLKRSTWERKMAVYKSFGWSEMEVLMAFRKQPMCMKMSEEKIKEGLEFYFNKLKLRPDDIIRYPKLLMPSLEKTIVPRCTVLSVLQKEEKLGKKLKFGAILTLPARLFLKRFVMRYHKDIPDVLKAYSGEIKFDGLEIDRG